MQESGFHTALTAEPAMAKQTVEQMVDQIMKLKEGTKIQVLAPLIKAQKGEHKEILGNLRKDGYSRVRVDGKIGEPTRRRIPSPLTRRGSTQLKRWWINSLLEAE